MGKDSNVAIYASIAANVAIAATKLTAAAVTGSSAMVAEGVHSLVDCADGGLLLLGQRRSRRPPDAAHQFGHGRELYFWTLIVAVLFFALGGGVSVYEGVQHIRRPELIRDPFWNYVVLGAATVFDGASFLIGFRQLRARAGGRGLWTMVRESKDPTLFTVVLEDIADLTGLGLAFLGVYFGHRLGNPYLDGLASIGVGLVLAGVAVVLVVQSRGLLVGDGADPATVRAIEAAAAEVPEVARVRGVRTIHLAPHEIVVVLDVGFERGLTIDGIRRGAIALDRHVREASGDVRHVYIDIGALGGARSDE